jgi:hypothetical protein
MVGISAERKQAVLAHMHGVRDHNRFGFTEVRRHNLPVYIDDIPAAKALVAEGVLSANDPDKFDDTCYRAGPDFRKGLKQYGVLGEPVLC